MIFVTMCIRPMTYNGRNEQDNVPRMTGSNPKFSSGLFALTDPALPSYQEDRFTIASVHIDPATIQRTIDKVPPEFQRQWDPEAVGYEFASQMLFVGIYDGSARICFLIYLPS